MDQYKGSDVDKYRCFMSGEGEKNTIWMEGAPPNYDAVNKLFEEGKTKIWPPGSLGEQVQNLVKTWEMELVHKPNGKDMKSTDAEKLFESIFINGRKAEGGAYNMFLQTSLPEKVRVYDPTKESSESAHKIFVDTFPKGFAMEVLEVYSGPPVIAYKFRHWGYMEGSFKGHLPTKEIAEMIGVSIFKLNEEFKIVSAEFFYDRGELLAGLIKNGSTTIPGDTNTDLSSSKCPFS
uniref:pathogen-related protein-like n=1 Tax=Erigeron canadensis TaxID=72917 RepID=UPI001CB97BC8|nr:pathogen-related protein-like [Erigeron canadensis]